MERLVWHFCRLRCRDAARPSGSDGQIAKNTRLQWLSIGDRQVLIVFMQSVMLNLIFIHKL